MKTSEFICGIILGLLIGFMGGAVYSRTPAPVPPKPVNFQSKTWDRCDASIVNNETKGTQSEILTCFRDVPVTCSAK